MKLRGQVETGTGGIHGDVGGQPSSAMGQEAPLLAVLGWAIAEKQFALARVNQLLAAMTGNESDEKLREIILHLVPMARSAPHQAHCPVRMLDGISSAALKALVADLPRTALMFVLEEERKCRAAARPGVGI